MENESNKKTGNLSLVERTENLAKKAMISSAKKKEATATQELIPTPQKNNVPNRGKSTLTIIEEAQLSLFQQELQGRFTNIPLDPQTEYPTLLTRLPIFLPIDASAQRALLNKDNAIEFETSWGKGKKYGPPLSMTDEDTLIALGRLRKSRLIGNPNHLPVQVSDLYRVTGEENVSVHITPCTVSQVQLECTPTTGGDANKLRLASIKRLAATTIEFDNKTADKLVGRGTTIKLIDVAWQEFADTAILYVQFTPIMSQWYDNEYTYIDFNIRKQLTDTGKAIHRFLSGQPKVYEIGTKKLMGTILYQRQYKAFMSDLRKTCNKLVDLGWITEWCITGTGRGKPQMLTVNRIKPSA